jgi:transposase-like protein
MNMKCPKCGSEHSIKSGKLHELQRYKCKSCNYQFTKNYTHRIDEKNRMSSILLHIFGLSFRKIDDIFGVSYTAVARWSREFMCANKEPTTSTIAIVITVGEQLYFIEKDSLKSGCNNFFEGPYVRQNFDHK